MPFTTHTYTHARTHARTNEQHTRPHMPLTLHTDCRTCTARPATHHRPRDKASLLALSAKVKAKRRKGTQRNYELRIEVFKVTGCSLAVELCRRGFVRVCTASASRIAVALPGSG